MTKCYMGTFLNFSNNFTSDLYDFNPSYKNFYAIEIYDMDSKNNENFIKNESNYSKFHAKSFHFDCDTFNLERNNITRNFTVKDKDTFSWGDVLRITYNESEDWEVKQYHETWISNFYDKSTDAFKSNALTASKSHLYKTIKLYLPKLSSKEDSYKTVVFHDVIPRNSGLFDLSWGTSPSIIEHSIEYYVKYWEWE